VKLSFTRSISKSFWYCLTSAFFGWVRMVTRSSSVRSSRVASHREPADELRDHPELDQVLGLDEREQLAHAAVVLGADVGAEAEPLLARAPLHEVLDAVEGAAADEEDVGGVDLDVLLLVVLLAAARSDVGARAFDDLEQRLLYALAAHVARGAGRIALARDLVDLVDVDDAALGLLHVVVGGVEQVLDDVLHVLAHVAGLGEAGGVGDGEGDVQEAGERLGKQRLAAAGRADEQDVRLLQLDVPVSLGPRRLHSGARAGGLARVDALVVVVDGDGEDLLRALLADHVVVEEALDLHRRGQRDRRPVLLALGLLCDDVVAELDALVADVDGGAGDELADFPLPLPAEGAGQVAVVVAVLSAHVTSSSPSVRGQRKGRQPRFWARVVPLSESIDVRPVTPETRRRRVAFLASVRVTRALHDPLGARAGTGRRRGDPAGRTASRPSPTLSPGGSGREVAIGTADVCAETCL
jgi:hypothetical protein